MDKVEPRLFVFADGIAALAYSVEEAKYLILHEVRGNRGVMETLSKAEVREYSAPSAVIQYRAI